MFDQVMDTFRKATESTIQLQQQMVQQWTQLWAQVPGAPTQSRAQAPARTQGPVAPPPVVKQYQTVQREVGAALTGLLQKHREILDAQYAAGIKTIEEAFRLGDAKDPAQFLRLVEEFWKHGFECLRSLSEEQIKGYQSATLGRIESTSKDGTTAGK